MKLANKLFEIKNKVKNIQPDAKGYGYEYASPTKVLRIFNDLFEEYRILCTPRITSTSAMICNTEAGEVMKDVAKLKKKGEILHTVNMAFTFEDLDSEETREVSWAGTGANSTEQGFGSAITYGSRYFYIHFFGLTIDKDDPDALHAKKAGQTGKPLKDMTQPQYDNLLKGLEQGNSILVKKLLAGYKDSALKAKITAKLK